MDEVAWIRCLLTGGAVADLGALSQASHFTSKLSTNKYRKKPRNLIFSLMLMSIERQHRPPPNFHQIWHFLVHSFDISYDVGVSISVISTPDIIITIIF